MSSGITERAFDLTVLGLHIAYVAVVIGIIRNEPGYLDVIDFWVKVFMSVFLLWRFNPFMPIRYTEFDRKVGFSAGIFLFTVTVVNKYLKWYVTETKKAARTAFKNGTSFLKIDL